MLGQQRGVQSNVDARLFQAPIHQFLLQADLGFVGHILPETPAAGPKMTTPGRDAVHLRLQNRFPSGLGLPTSVSHPSDAYNEAVSGQRTAHTNRVLPHPGNTLPLAVQRFNLQFQAFTAFGL